MTLEHSDPLTSLLLTLALIVVIGNNIPLGFALRISSHRVLGKACSFFSSLSTYEPGIVSRHNKPEDIIYYISRTHHVSYFPCRIQIYSLEDHDRQQVTE